MDTRLPDATPNDDLLVSWKDIAAYLKCSVRKAQRLERQELPVNRIPGTKSVWALRPEIDQWLTLKAEMAKRLQAQSSGGRASRLAFFPGRLWALAILLALTAASTIASAYGLTIVFFVVTVACVVLVYPSLPDTSYARAAIGLFVIAGMSYGTSVTTLPDVVGSVINMMTLRPALAYPFVIGLRFIPIPILTSILLVVLTFRNNTGFVQNPGLRRGYLFFGALFLFGTAIAGLSASGAYRIWQAGLPIRWTLLAGESFVFGVNLTLFLLGYQFFNTSSIKGFRQLISWYGTGYLLIALTAAIIDRHWNEINKYHLDTRWPHAYRVQNSNAVDALRDWLQRHTAEAGPDLMSLSNDPEFLRALRTQEFYKQDFDEPFQVSNKAVIFGYKSDRNSRDKRPVFVLIRFPAGLAATLRFELVVHMS
ncbi:MAG TPA: hypothetical protein VE422_45075 [Terriglobia bacterium]|nr:hypothetical protein [Terriglobia bacterium]